MAIDFENMNLEELQKFNIMKGNIEERTCLNCSLLEKNDGVYTCELMNLFIKDKYQKEEDIHPEHIKACLYHNGNLIE